MNDDTLEVRKIVHIAARVLNVEPAEVYSSSRRVAAVVPRQIACYVALAKIGISSKAIGRAIGRDHSSVLHAIEKVEARLRNSDRKTEALIEHVWKTYDGQIPMPEEITEEQPMSKTVAPPSKDVCDEVRKLRARGLPVDRIAERVGANEFLVAKLCGVNFWKHRNVNEVLSS